MKPTFCLSTALGAFVLLSAAQASAQDCTGFIGKFRGAEGVINEITDAGDGTLSIKLGETGTATATCLAPLVNGDKSYPQAQATGMDASEDVAFDDPACCVMTLNGNQISFSTTGRYWQRTK